MKILLCFLLSLISSLACDATKAISGAGGLLLTLQPGIPQIVEWDMSDCSFGIQNWAVYVQQPRPCPSCLQKNLHPNTPLDLICQDLTTGASTACPNFIGPMGTVSLHQLRLTLTLSPRAKKPLPVEVSTTAAFGGLP